MYLEFYGKELTLTAEEEHAIYDDYSKTMRVLDMPMEASEFDQASVVSHYLYFIDALGKPSPVTARVLDRVRSRKAVMT